MKALFIVSKGVLEIREQINPEAAAGEVLVRVRAAGVNNADLGQRMGLYPAPADSPQNSGCLAENARRFEVACCGRDL
jgi:NADPH:quinone reductase